MKMEIEKVSLTVLTQRLWKSMVQMLFTVLMLSLGIISYSCIWKQINKEPSQLTPTK